MDARHFDTLTRALGEAGTRRGALRALAALPLLGGLFALLDLHEADAAGRRKRRKKAHKHGKGRDKGKHKKQQQHKKHCKPQSHATTCAGKCGSVKNTCNLQKTVDCGPCDCEPPCGVCETCSDDLTCEVCEPCCDEVCCAQAKAICHADSGACCVPDSMAQTCGDACGDVVNNCGVTVDCGSCTCGGGCPECQICDEETDDCLPDPLQEGDPCGGDGQICLADGACACDAGSCAPGERCHDQRCVCDGARCDDGCCGRANAVCHRDSAVCCVRDSQAQTCDGQCGEVTDNCGFGVDCGLCTCTPACGACLTCDGETSACVADPIQEGGSCGAPGQVCQADGACECDPGSCAPCETCQGNGLCSLPCGGSGCCDANGECHGGDSVEFCGTDGESCTACDGEEICRADGQGETCRLNQAPDAFNLTYNDDWGKACIVVTLLGADPDGDPLAFRLLSKPTNGKLFVYDEDAVDHLGVQVQPGDPAVPAEAGTDGLRLCYETNNRFFFGSDSFRYISIDTHGAESPIVLSSPGPPATSGKSYIQINVFET